MSFRSADDLLALVKWVSDIPSVGRCWRLALVRALWGQCSAKLGTVWSLLPPALSEEFGLMQSSR